MFQCKYRKRVHPDVEEDRSIVKAKDIVTRFLRFDIEVLRLRKAFMRFFVLSKKIQTKWKSYCNTKNGFYMMLGVLWDGNYERIFQNVTREQATHSGIKFSDIKT